MTTFTDLDGLARWIVVPPGVVAASWEVERMGEPGALDMLGPIDTQLAAYLRFASADDAVAALPSLPNAPRVEIPYRLAAQVVPEAVLDGLAHLDGELLLPGPFLDGAGLGRGPYRDPVATIVGDALLLFARTW